MLLWAANFVVSLSFPVLLDSVGIGWLFLGFAVICALAHVFAARFVVETKGAASRTSSSPCAPGRPDPRADERRRGGHGRGNDRAARVQPALEPVREPGPGPRPVDNRYHPRQRRA
ncbi:MFS transporter [Streptomyces sp. M10(2022)]